MDEGIQEELENLSCQEEVCRNGQMYDGPKITIYSFELLVRVPVPFFKMRLIASRLYDVSCSIEVR